VCPPAPESRRRADPSRPDTTFRRSRPRPTWPCHIPHSGRYAISTTAVQACILSDNCIYSSKPRCLGNDEKNTADVLPATYRYYEAPRKRVVGNPADDVPAFLRRELSLGGLADMLKHLWFAGAERPATPLHLHVAMGRQIAIADRMDLHLLRSNKGRVFVKPVPRFLLDPAFCSNNLLCPDGCVCYDPPEDTCRGIARKVALGFLYTYACLTLPRLTGRKLVPAERRLLTSTALRVVEL